MTARPFEIRFGPVDPRGPLRRVPVRLSIAGTEFFALEASSDPWLALEVPRFATAGLAALAVLPTVGRVAIELDDYGHALLLQRRSPYQIVVASTMRACSERILASEFDAAWTDFYDRALFEYDRVFPRMHTDLSFWNVRAAAETMLSRAEQRLVGDWFREYADLFTGEDPAS